MSAGITFVRVHEPAQVREIIAEARAIAAEHSQVASDWDAIFGKAVDLLSARTVVQTQPTALPFDLRGIRAGG